MENSKKCNIFKVLKCKIKFFRKIPIGFSNNFTKLKKILIWKGEKNPKN